MDEEALKRKLATIEASFAGATSTAGGNQEADSARDSILARLKAATEAEPAIDFQFSLADEWQRRLFAALARRYGLKPFRYTGQRDTTVMLRAPERFVEDVFWPEYQQLSAALRSWLDEATERIMREVLQSEGGSVEETADAPPLESSAAGSVA
jgi:hypothetical protein